MSGLDFVLLREAASSVGDFDFRSWSLISRIAGVPG
jgi:hypothetical protein